MMTLNGTKQTCANILNKCFKSKLAWAAMAVAAVYMTAGSPAYAGSKFSASSGPMGAQIFSLSLATDAGGPIMQAKIHTPNKKDLLIGVSLETLLTTRTRVKSKGGDKDTQAVRAGISITVLVDGLEAMPGKVVFDERVQEMTAIFGGIIESCTDGNGDGTITVADECVVTDEELELLLSTAGARHFNFMMADLEPGDHIIDVMADIIADPDYDGDGTPGEAVALYGKRTLSVEEVAAINQDGGITEIP
jgi:hypothetical protein